MFWRTNPKLLRKIKHRQAIASKMPQTKSEARKACFEAAQQHRITVLKTPSCGKSTDRPTVR